MAENFRRFALLEHPEAGSWLGEQVEGDEYAVRINWSGEYISSNSSHHPLSYIRSVAGGDWRGRYPSPTFTHIDSPHHPRYPDVCVLIMKAVHGVR